MKHIFFPAILVAFCFVTYADDSEITVDDLSSGTEIVLDGDETDNNKNSQEYSDNESDMETEESVQNADDYLSEADSEDIHIQNDQESESDTIKTESTAKRQQKESHDTIYTVQLGAFRSRERAFAFHWKISKRIANTRVDTPSRKNRLYRVCCGTFPNYEEAKEKANKLKKYNVNCFVSKISPSKK